MESLAYYLIKSSVWLTGFALVYLIFLRNERFFTLNRIYLVCGILVSVIFPFFTWHYTVVLPIVPNIEISDPQVQGIVVPEEPLFTAQNVLLFFYLSGIIYLIFRIIRQTLPVFRIIRKSETHQYSSAKLIRTAEYPASFSFFSFVFVNPSIDEIETNEIVNHELEHIRQQHWIDLLLFEILRTAQWFNPVSWLYGRLIRQNHEYLADEQALQRTSNPAIYRAALLNQMFGGPVISLANSFNYSLNKKRFNMMKQTISSPIRKLKLLLVLPLMAGVFYAFSAPEYKFVQASSNNEVQSQTKDGKTITGKVVNENGKPLKGASIVVSGKTIGTATDANGNFKLEMPDNSPIVISYVGFGSQKVNPDFEKEMVIIMKTATVKIDLGDDVSASQPESDVYLEKWSDIQKYFAGKKPPLYVLDDEIGKAVKADPNKKDNLAPETIESIKVLGRESAVKKYGEKGKNGVVEITRKKKASTIENKSSSITQTIEVHTNSPFKFGNSDGSGNQPLIVKDGVIVKDQNADNISPETIESIEILKGEAATILYGKKGNDGVILIKTKKEASASPNGTTEVKVTGYANDQKENQSKSGIQIRSTGTSETEPKPLIVIDGVIAENQNMDKIDPETVESIAALKDESATKKYGEKGKNGVIEITSKSKTPFTMVEEMPSFPGGIEALRTYVSSTMKYPVIALESGIQGQVFVKFIVVKDGRVTNAKVTRGVDPSIDNEALRIVKSMPKWNPGKQNGENVDVAYEIPINFTIPKDYHPKSKEKLRTKAAKIGNINWVNNTIYNSSKLNSALGIKKGDAYSKENLSARVQDEVSSLYLDNGYVFSKIDITEIPKSDGTVDLNFTVYEGKQGKISNIGIKGNKNVSTKDILNEIKIKPGDLFSKAKIIQSIRALGLMGKFNPEKINPNIIPGSKVPNSEFINVDLVFNVTEK